MATCKGCCKMGYPLQAGYCGGCRCGTSQTFCKHDRERSWNHSNHVVHKDPAPLLGGLQHDVGASLRDLYPFRRHPKAVCDCTRCKRETRLRRDTGSVLGSPACSSTAPRSGSRGGGASRRSARSPAAAKRGFRPTSSASAASAPRYGGGGAREPFPLARQPLSLVGDVDDDDCGAGCGEEDGAYEQARRRAFEQGYLSRDDGGGGGGIEEDEAYRKLMSAFQTIRGAVLEQQEREAATTTSSRGKRRSGGGGGGGSGLRTYPSPLSEGGGWSAASPPTSAAPLGRGKAPAAAVSPAASNADVSASMASAIAERDRLLRLSTTRQPPRAAATAAANVGEDVFQRPRQPQAAAPEASRARGAGAIFSAYDGAAARRTPVEPGGGGSGGYGGGGPPRPLDVAREEAWRRRQQQQQPPRPISPVVGAAATHDAFAAASAAAAAAASASEAEAASEASSAASHEFLELAQAEERAEALAAEREALYGEGSISRRRAEERRSAEAVEAGYPAFPPERQRTGGGGGNEAGGTVTVNVKAVPVEQAVTTTVLRHKTTVEATPVFGEAAVTDASASGDSPSRSPAGLLPSGDAGPPPGVGELSYLLDTEVAMQPSGDAGLTLSVNRTLDLRM